MHERRVVDTVYDQQYVRWICVDVELALRGERPVERCDRDC
jgi:hypothetical protein